MPTIYLHVGPHKTGSTYLQEIFANQAGSIQKQGVEYPLIGREYSTGHHNIAWFFAEKPLIDAKQSTLSRDLLKLANEGNRNILFSSEEFSKIPAPKLKRLKNTFSKWDFHILYFMRKGSAFITSLWQESIKNGSTTPMNKVTLSSLTENLQYNPFDHAENNFRFENCLEGKISTFNYNNLLEKGGSLTQPISETLKVDLESKKKKINPSMKMEIIELIRAANLYNADIGKRRRGFPRIASLRILNFPFLGSKLIDYIKSQYKEQSVSIIAKSFLEKGFQASDLLSEDINRTYNYIPETVLLDKLNKDNILSWRIIKKMIREK